jgi:uncharacterized membrane protein YdcZ (DUF606 family)
MQWFALVIAIVSGFANPFQAAINGELNKQLHAPV